jgi:uncharacterized protein GlcG (DUF336 family)
MTVVILDEEGQLISADRMEGASFHLERFAKGKALASLIMRDRTEAAAELSKTRPDRYFGIMNMYPGEVYLVGGGLPLAVGNRLVGAYRRRQAAARRRRKSSRRRHRRVEQIPESMK